MWEWVIAHRDISGPVLTFAYGHRPSPRVPNVILFGFLSITAYIGVCHAITSSLSTSQSNMLTAFPSQGCYGLPQNTSRPEGEMVEVTINPNVNNSIQFRFISLESQGPFGGTAAM